MPSYLKQPIGLLTLPEPLDPAIYRIAADTTDYRRGAYLPLTPEQATFAAQHPAATPEEILALALTPPSLEELRSIKLAELDAYDASPAVNSFTLGGSPMWLDKATRVGLANSIAIESNAGRTTTRLWFNNHEYTFPIDLARKLLAAVELYALETYNITARHRAAILDITDTAALAAYDITTLYPQPLNLDTLCAEDN